MTRDQRVTRIINVFEFADGTFDVTDSKLGSDRSIDQRQYVQNPGAALLAAWDALDPYRINRIREEAARADVYGDREIVMLVRELLEGEDDG